MKHDAGDIPDYTPNVAPSRERELKQDALEKALRDKVAPSRERELKRDDYLAAPQESGRSLTGA